ncbi:MAG: hypothetical protein GAK29_01555 [Acinetobacter bereziniae]|uniref:Uncharacterized protein n=1 Tax=Acinetobacter bereziniae TaxID=106648 RepID=A0A833PHS0_ACIBZ|nr:MAG: hypothetical protein GAK29_01555 [Acinetobacter bereziniae]
MRCFGSFLDLLWRKLLILKQKYDQNISALFFNYFLTLAFIV